MRYFQTTVCAILLSAAAALPVHAGWDNVFQPTLFERWRQPTTTTAQYYVAPVVVRRNRRRWSSRSPRRATPASNLSKGAPPITFSAATTSR